jgi:hypothetical protein
LHKTVEEIKALPASEIVDWMEYYGIFPFPQDREDFRMARICEAINQTAKGLAMQQGSWKFFMPDYLRELDLQEVLDQIDINREMAWAAYIDSQERANDGNQTSGT